MMTLRLSGGLSPMGMRSMFMDVTHLEWTGRINARYLSLHRKMERLQIPKYGRKASRVDKAALKARHVIDTKAPAHSRHAGHDRRNRRPLRSCGRGVRAGAAALRLSAGAGAGVRGDKRVLALAWRNHRCRGEGDVHLRRSRRGFADPAAGVHGRHRPRLCQRGLAAMVAAEACRLGAALPLRAAATRALPPVPSA